MALVALVEILAKEWQLVPQPDDQAPLPTDDQAPPVVDERVVVQQLEAAALLVVGY